MTVYEQAIDPRGPRVALASLTSTDQAGIQQASMFLDAGLDFDEFDKLYYLEIVVTKTDPKARVLIYDISLRDVL